jgi:hypothetical protein
MNATLRDALLTYTRAHPPGPNGITRTGVEGLAIVRSDAPTPLEHLLYEPALIVVVDGAKELMLGDTLLTYTPGHYLVLSVGLPLLASITRASAAAPYLALALTIDLPLIGDLIRELPPAPLAAAGARHQTATPAASPLRSPRCDRSSRSACRSNGSPRSRT